MKPILQLSALLCAFQIQVCVAQTYIVPKDPHGNKTIAITDQGATITGPKRSVTVDPRAKQDTTSSASAPRKKKSSSKSH